MVLRRPIGLLMAAGALVAAGCSEADVLRASDNSIPATSAHITDATEPASSTTSTSSTVAPATTAASASPTTAPVIVAPATTRPATGGDEFTAIAPIMESFVDAEGLNGAGLVVVDREDGIVHEEYVGEFSADRVSLVASSSKMITAGVLLHLADEGLLDLDAPVADVVDWGAGNPTITPAQLVSNSSGLVGLGPNPAYGPYLCQFLRDRELEECAAELFQTPADDVDVIAPDTEFRYGGAQWQVAGAIAEAVSGKSWAQLIDEIYVEPCGVASLGYNNHWFDSGGFAYPAGFDPADLTPTENPQMEGGGYISAPDYAALLLMHLRGGMCDGGRVLSEESVERAHADRVAAEYGASADQHPGYGMGWWVNRDTGIISDEGAYGSMPWLDIEDGYGAYLVVEASAGQGLELFRELEPVVEAIMSTR